MDHSQFIQSISDAGLSVRYMSYFHDTVILRWLDDNKWIEDPTSGCKWCAHMDKVNHRYSEEKCRENRASGGSCYRETLKRYFLPFLRNALRGIYPTLEELKRTIHHKGSIWDGIDSVSILGITIDELGATYMRMSFEASLH